MATLGLSMIVRDEEETLPRCLESVRGLFDELVVVDTGSTDRTKGIASSFGAKIHEFAWIDDFSAARNFSFGQVSSDFIMWLDADDVLKSEDLVKLRRLKDALRPAHAYLMAYDYAQDEFGNSMCRLYRHRIVPRRPEVFWKYPIHECLSIPEAWRQVMTDITVTHKRTAKEAARDAGRNLALLRKAADKSPDDRRIQFYLGKELAHAGLVDEAIPVLRSFLTDPDWHENRISAHLLLAQCYYRKGEWKKVIETCFGAIHIDPRWAEFYVLIGEVYYNRKDWTKAIQWYETASKMKLPETAGTIAPENYTWIPHDRLCKCYSNVGKIRRAYEANEMALGYRPTDERLLYNQRYLRDVLFDRLNERPYRLSLGSGGKPVPSYRRTARAPGPDVDCVFDPAKLPYDTATVHAIYAEHVLEYMGHEEALGSIAEWARALRHGGALTLKVVDLDLSCEAFLRSEDRKRDSAERWTPKEWFRYALYGGPLSKDGASQNGHRKTGFTKAELGRLLSDHGFEVEHLESYDANGIPSIEVRAVQTRQAMKVCWLLRGDVPDDLRVRLFNVSEWLATRGIHSEMNPLYASGSEDLGAMLNELRRYDIVVVTKPGAVEEKLADLLNRCGVGTVYCASSGPGLGDEARTIAHFSRRVVFWSEEQRRSVKDVHGIVIPGALGVAELCLEDPGQLQGKTWVSLFEEICRENCDPPSVDIVIAARKDEGKHLRRAIEAIRKNTDWPYRMMVIGAIDEEIFGWIKKQADVSFQREDAQESWRVLVSGLSLTKAPYACILDANAIVCQGWLGALMHEAVKPGVGAVGPLSNLDRDLLQKERLLPDRADPPRGLDKERMEEMLPELYEWSHPKAIRTTDQLPLYCIAFPRVSVEKILSMNGTGRGEKTVAGLISDAGGSLVQTLDACIVLPEDKFSARMASGHHAIIENTFTVKSPVREAEDAPA